MSAKKVAKKAKPKAKKPKPTEPKHKEPIPGPVEQEVKEADLTNTKGQPVIIGPDKLRLMQADVLSAIVNRFSGDKLADLLEELTNATTTTKGGNVIPDNRTRLAAGALIMAYCLGKPIERQEILNINMGADTAHNLAEKLKSSPALRAAFRSILEQAEAAGVMQETLTADPPPVAPAELPPMKQAKKKGKKSGNDLEFED